jgi:flagellar basal body-associated protein FliL
MKPGRILLTSAVILALSGAAARAADDKKDSAPQTIQLETVALPVIVNGRLLNYVFVSIRLELMSKADGAEVRAKEQFFRDDLVRVGHRTPFLRKDDYTQVDEAKVRAELMRFAASIVGPGVLKNAVITKQVSQKNIATPRSGPAPAREIVP